MELIIQILMLFIAVNTLLKLSFWKWWQSALFGLVCAVFVIVSCQWAIQQSKTQLADYLSNPHVLQNMAVLITIESMLCFAYCFAAFQSIDVSKRKRVALKLLHWYSGLLLFPVLFYLFTQSIYSFPGTDFTYISYILAATAFAAIPLLSYAVKRFYPETALRLEVHFLVGLFVCIIGLITTVNGNVTYAASEEAFSLRAILLSAGLFILMFLLGIFWNKVKWRIKLKGRREN